MVEAKDKKPTEPDSATSQAAKASETLSVRVSPHSYVAAVLVGSFLSALSFYLRVDSIGVALFLISWIVIPFLAFNDRVKFDGKRLYRTGIVPALSAWFRASRRRLRLSDIEYVETEALRAMRRGNNVYFRYRTILAGKGIGLVIASGGDEYRRLIRAVLRQLPDEVLDIRSADLRDHLNDPKETILKAETARIPSAEFLTSSDLSVVKNASSTAIPRPETMSRADALSLKQLANELRIAGNLVQAVEALRRALAVRPHNPELLFDLAKCLYSLAKSRRDGDLERRAFAAVRLAERRAGDDPRLIVRLGEWYSDVGDDNNAARLFRRAVESSGENFRALRGLGEIALRDGKIAHVIHHFAAAIDNAGLASQRRWSKNEAAYFANLNSDPEYMELEVGRVRMLEGIERTRRSAIRIAIIGVPVIVAGVVLDNISIANVGWAVSTVAIMVWFAMLVGTRMFGRRIPYEFVEDRD